MLEYIPCLPAPALHWGPLPATRLASREILIEQNIKKRTGPSLWLLCGNEPVRILRIHRMNLYVCGVRKRFERIFAVDIFRISRMELPVY
jgi:hypothetical protein